jgi:hypothetical protein
MNEDNTKKSGLKQNLINILKNEIQCKEINIDDLLKKINFNKCNKKDLIEFIALRKILSKLDTIELGLSNNTQGNNNNTNNAGTNNNNNIFDNEKDQNDDDDNNDNDNEGNNKIIPDDNVMENNLGSHYQLVNNKIYKFIKIETNEHKTSFICPICNSKAYYYSNNKKFEADKHIDQTHYISIDWNDEQEKIELQDAVNYFYHNQNAKDYQLINNNK